MKQDDGYTNKELMGMIKRLHKDNEHDTISGIRKEFEFIALQRIHERNNIINMLIKKINM